MQKVVVEKATFPIQVPIIYQPSPEPVPGNFFTVPATYNSAEGDDYAVLRKLWGTIE